MKSYRFGSLFALVEKLLSRRDDCCALGRLGLPSPQAPARGPATGSRTLSVRCSARQAPRRSASLSLDGRGHGAGFKDCLSDRKQMDRFQPERTVRLMIRTTDYWS